MALVVLGSTIELAITYQQEFWSVLMEILNIPAYAWNWSTDTSAAINSAIWTGLADFNCEMKSSFLALAKSTKAISKEPFLGLLSTKEKSSSSQLIQVTTRDDNKKKQDTKAEEEKSSPVVSQSKQGSPQLSTSGRLVRLSTSQYERLDFYAKLVYDVRVQFGVDKTIADAMIVSPFIFGAMMMAAGLILMTVFLTGWDSTRTIAGFKALWIYFELPTYVFLALLVVSFFGIIVYNYRFEVEINFVKFMNSVIIEGFNGFGSISFGIMAWIFELTGNFFGMFCELFNSFSEASLSVGEAL